MRKFWSCVGVLVACLGLAVACGDQTGSLGNNGDDDPNLSETGQSIYALADEYAETVCARAFNCCDSEERDQLSDGGVNLEDESQCITSYTEYFQITLALEQVAEAEEAGSVVYHADEASNCIAQLEAQECSAGLFPSGSPGATRCDEAFEGQIDEGGECDVSEECRMGMCEREYDENGAPSETGTCVSGAGAECQWHDECGDGTYCEFEFDPDTGAESASCQPIGQEGDSCSDHQGCEGDLHCGGELGNETCRSKANIGDDCAYGECVDEAFCDVEWDSNTGEETGTCKARAVVGEPCVFEGCVETAYCDTSGDDPICRDKTPAGEPCETSEQCQSNLCVADSNDPDADPTCQAEDSGNDQMCTGN